MVTCISRSPEATFLLGEAWGREAQPGWVLALSGDLGSGKTQLATGFARGLGVFRQVHSPTFALVHEHGGGRLPLAHVDLYRLETPEQILAAGLEPYLYPVDRVAVVEWAERWFDIPSNAAQPTFLRRVHLEWLTESERRIVYEDTGAGILLGTPQRGTGG